MNKQLDQQHEIEELKKILRDQAIKCGNCGKMNRECEECTAKFLLAAHYHKTVPDAERREKIASHYMIQCQNSKDFECPYLDTCPHEDKEICQWQLDQADQILSLIPKPRLELISDEEIDYVGICEDELHEIEQQASIGIGKHDHIDYKQNFEWLFQDKLKRKAAKAQLSDDQEKCK